VAGFVSEILRGSTDEDAIRFANACGAICTTAIGAATALKDREQVIRWMKNQEMNLNSSTGTERSRNTNS